MREIGERLAWVRDIMGLSQNAMANIVGVTQTAWGKYELGQRTPDQFEIPRIAAKLKISVPYILRGCLDDVEREMAIRLAARHPQLVQNMNKCLDTDTDRS